MSIERIDTFTVPPRWIFVRVTTADAQTGWGEAIVPKRVQGVRGAVADLAANLVGADAGRIDDVWLRMHRDGFFRGGPILSTAAAAIEQALWDIKGRRLGVAVHDLLGGRVRESVATYAWVGGDRPVDVLAHVQQRVDQGFTAVKMNATSQLDFVDHHSQVDAVIARVAAIRAQFGDDLGIALDFHGRVHRAMARVLLTELRPFHLMWVEEAAAPECDDIFPALRQAAGPIPLATGERCVSRWQFKALLEQRAVDILQPDVSLTGLHELVKICHMAEAYDIAVAPHCPNGPISLAASLQAGFCCANVIIQEQSGGLHYNSGYAGLPSGELFDYLDEPGVLQQEHGHFRCTDTPGLGVTVNTEIVQARDQDWRMPDPNWRHEDGRPAEW